MVGDNILHAKLHRIYCSGIDRVNKYLKSPGSVLCPVFESDTSGQLLLIEVSILVITCRLSTCQLMT